MNIPTPIPVALGGTGQATALGTGVATALTVNTGAAGGMVLFNGAGGTPSSLTLTNATGLVASTGTTATGTPSSTTFLRGDNTWATPAGGGTGTVTNTGGNLTANSVVLGAGTVDSKVVAGITTDGVSQLNLGVNTTTLGKVKMFGNTSGDATIQPAAAAGTATVLTLPAVTGTLATLGNAETFSGIKTFSAAPVLNALPTGTAIASAATASTIMTRDASTNTNLNNLFEGFTSTATAAGTTALTITSTKTQVFTGTLAQTVTLPTTSVPAGGQYLIINQSTGAVTVQSSGANTIVILAAGTSAIFTAVVATPTTAANWNSQYLGLASASGKALTVSNSLTLAGTDGKTLTISNSLTLAGTDGNTMTFPSGSSTVMTLASTDTITGVKTYSTAPVLNALPTGTAVASAATVSTLMTRDSSGNANVNNIFDGFTTTATAAGTTTMTITSTQIQVWTGSSTQTIKLPTTSVPAGAQYQFVNQSTGKITIQSSGANTIAILANGDSAIFTALVATPTTAANWAVTFVGSLGRQNDTSNTITTGPRIESGWGVFAQAAVSNKSETVTFGQAFATAPIVVISGGGDQTGGTIAYGNGGNTEKGPIAIKAYGVTTTAFTAHAHTSDGTSWSATANVYYQWIAIGS